MLNSYLLKNGTLLSVTTGEEKKADILVKDGTIVKVQENIQDPAAENIDCTGMYITVGWIDSHCHFAKCGEGVSLDVEKDVLSQGVSYAVDMGTLGPAHYAEYREKLLYRTNLHFRSFLNIGSWGAGNRPIDFEGPQDIEPEKVKEVATRYRSELLGLKARIDDKFCFDPVYVMGQLRALGDELNMRIAVHAPRSRIGIEKLLTYLKPGDVLCHTLAGNSDVMEVLNEDGTVKRAVLDAHERGVILDLSHGTNAYSYRTAEEAWKAGFFVDTISSDLHGGNINGPLYNFGNVLTKMRGLTGKPWYWILNKAIVEPVRLLQIPDKAVALAEGMTADITVFKIENGEFTMPDSKKEERTFKEKVVACYTCVGQNVYKCRS